MTIIVNISAPLPNKSTQPPTTILVHSTLIVQGVKIRPATRGRRVPSEERLAIRRDSHAISTPTPHRQRQIAILLCTMDPGASPPGSPAGGPLQPATPERVNRQDPLFSPIRSENRDNVVHDKISQFNNMSIAMQSKQLERKTADAALKRAMLGREEAEADAKRLREENRLLRKEVEGGKERERKVGERLEAVMVSASGRPCDVSAGKKAVSSD